MVPVPGRGDVRVYAAVDVGVAFGVTAKTVVAWTAADRRRGPRLTGWAPRTVDPGERRWLVDADEVDDELAARRAAPVSGDDADRRTLAEERQRLADERQLFELERSLFVRERVEQLEDQNASLLAEVDHLRTQLAALGALVRDLTTTTGERR